MDKLERSSQKYDQNCTVEIMLHSPGFWNLDIEEGNGFLNYVLPCFLIQLSIMFLLTQFLHQLFKRFYFPRVISEITAGIILGPTIFGRSYPKLAQVIFARGEVFMEIASRMGYIFFMFLVGVKMDPGMVHKTGRKAWNIGVVSFVIPFLIAFIMSQLLDPLLPRYRRPAIKSLISIQTLTPFPVIACLLMDLKITNSELGRLVLSSALISDLLSTLFSTLQNSMRLAFAGGMLSMALQSFIITLVLFLIVVHVIRPAFVWVVKRTPEGKPVESFYVTLIAAVVLLSAHVSENVGLQYQILPFLLGLSVPVGPPLGSTLVEKLEALVSGLFAPLLVTVCGFNVDLLAVYDMGFLKIVWGIFVFSAMIKSFTTFIPAVICKVPFKDAIAFSAIMNVQGIVELALYHKLYLNQTIDRETFGSAILSVMLLAVSATLVERLFYDYSRTYTGYQKRNIFNAPDNAELRILVCANRPDDAMAAVKLLEASNPTKESPIAAYALNLVELRGRASPLLINHGLGQTAASGGTGCRSRSQQMIDIFHSYQRHHPGLASVHVFTALSLPKFMHEDICFLAFDKVASLIILPFHRKWNYQGQVVLDSNALRTMNRYVLDMAPCSVGILIDRRKLSRSSTAPSLLVYQYRVAVVFLGGQDDREAVALGRRMAKSSAVHLTVVRLIGLDEMHGNQWEIMLDAESLKDIRMRGSEEDNNVVYREAAVRDGSVTTSVIRSMEEEFDLMIVGRRHRDDLPQLSGLAEWMELPELGPLGDVLASADIDKPVSVVVVQQQLTQVK